MPYLDCAVGLAGPGPDGVATDDVLRALERVVRAVISCVDLVESEAASGCDAVIVIEGGIGVGAEEVDVILAHPAASQPCGPGTYLDWGNVTMFIEPTTGLVSDIWVVALGPYTSDCSGDVSDF